MIKRILISLYGRYHLAERNIRWYMEYLKCKVGNPQQHLESLETEVKRLLIIVPHADDELLGCSQLLSSTNIKSTLFYLGFTGENDSVRNSERRLKELKTLQEYFNTELVVSQGKPNEELASLMDEIEPDLIALPSIVDWHSEHLEANYLLKEVKAAKRPSILLYAVSIPISPYHATHYLPMTAKVQRKKWTLFRRVYISQKNIPVSRFRLNEKISGYYTGNHSAELYLLYTYDEWLNQLSKLQSIKTEMAESLKLSLKSLKEGRDRSLYWYNQFENDDLQRTNFG